MVPNNWQSLHINQSLEVAAYSCQKNRVGFVQRLPDNDVDNLVMQFLEPFCAALIQLASSWVFLSIFLRTDGMIAKVDKLHD